jgi:hypothetical protein
MGAGIGFAVGFNPYKVFVVVLILQIAISFIIKQIQVAYTTVRIREVELAKITEFSKQGLELECAYCGTINYIPLRFDQDNNFTCEKCNKDNSIYINVTTAQITSPLNISQITSTSFKDEPIITNE